MGGPLVDADPTLKLELRARLDAHIATEHETLGAYEDLADHVSDPVVRFVIELVLEDERRHHRSLVDIADALAGRSPAGPAGLTSTRQSTQHDPELLQATRHLLSTEREDASDLRTLARKLSMMRGTGLWQLLVRLMEMDSQKHVEMLHFVEAHARGGLELGG